MLTNYHSVNAQPKTFAHSTSSYKVENINMTDVNPDIVDAAAKATISAHTQTAIDFNITVF
jgi:hypothetical protein